MQTNYFDKNCYHQDRFARLIEGLKAALLDERRTAEFYGRLRDMSETFAGVDTFAEARRDEQDHARKITDILENLTGMTPDEATSPVRPPQFRNYCDGIKMAIEGERNAIREYTELSRILPIETVNNTLEEIISDEEVHLAKLQKLYEMVCCNKYYNIDDEKKS